MPHLCKTLSKLLLFHLSPVDKKNHCYLFPNEVYCSLHGCCDSCGLSCLLGGVSWASFVCCFYSKSVGSVRPKFKHFCLLLLVVGTYFWNHAVCLQLYLHGFAFPSENSTWISNFCSILKPDAGFDFIYFLYFPEHDIFKLINFPNTGIYKWLFFFFYSSLCTNDHFLMILESTPGLKLPPEDLPVSKWIYYLKNVQKNSSEFFRFVSLGLILQ